MTHDPVHHTARTAIPAWIRRRFNTSSDAAPRTGELSITDQRVLERLEEIDTARIQCGGKEIQGVQRVTRGSRFRPSDYDAWHTFHDAEYPYRSEKRVKLMLKGSGRQDALIPRRPEKSPVLISDLAELFRTLSGRGPEAEAVKDLAVVAFWGMARMAELTYTSNSGRINFKKGTTAQDVLYFQNAIIVNIHEAKTAKPGEVQVLKLRSINSPLCP
ncbi:hypothetical protein PSHT_06786 [Puccinia striiformis]|uniref:Uncharacterized protein n=1 Tax=Puccinia striiformis TaxID=27350 RepID=A0A2S4W3P6_9BASI|nr:hypothetical protein PSHT_06786 [Puccinia striiformis]